MSAHWRQEWQQKKSWEEEDWLQNVAHVALALVEAAVELTEDQDVVSHSLLPFDCNSISLS